MNNPLEYEKQLLVDVRACTSELKLNRILQTIALENKHVQR